jgi:3-hydroxybutyryl-CoA dehydrogenase
MALERIAVLGAGLMGHGIAQIFAAAGHAVVLFDTSAEVLTSAPERIRAIFKLLDQDESLASNVRLEPDFEAAVADAELVIEAAPEKLNLKQEIFGRLEKATRPDAILASNTSALPITEIARPVNTADRVVGTHFWNPPHLIPLVEVVQAERTSAATVAKTMALLKAAGKSPVHVKRDVPGFIGNRLQHALKREAIAIVADGICDAATLDTVVKDGFGARLGILGPLEQSDLIGLNITLDVHATLLKHLNRDTEPHPYLVDKVRKGETGMKVGKGFMDWTPEQAAAVRERVNRLLVEAARARAKARTKAKV